MKKSLKIAFAAAAFTALMSITAFAATTISNITIKAGAPDDEISSGYADPEFFTDDEGFTIESADLVGSYPTSPKTSVTYELTLCAESGYTFPSSANSVTVNAGSGVASISSKKIDKDETDYMTVKVKAYPYYQWEKPSFAYVDADDGTKKSIKVEKPSGASKVEYIIVYEDYSGNEKSKASSTTGTSISVSNYNKKYTGKDEDKKDMVITGVAIRVSGPAGSNTHVAPSEWEIEGTVDTEDYGFKSYENWEELDGSGISSNKSSSSSSSSQGPSNWNKGKWSGSGNTWYWINTDGSKRKNDWVDDGGNWYYLGSDGLMKYGWFEWNGDKYYLNTNHDGTFGKMLTGKAIIDGVQYQFNTSHDGTYGKLMK